jgi:hypothetical protein
VASTSASDDGFITPIFGVLAIAMAVVALAYLQLAKTDERAARREWDRTQEEFAAEGVMNIAAWTVMNQPGSPVMSWDERTTVGAMQVTVEPEMRKLSLNELGSPRGFAKLSRLVGGAEAADLARRVLSLPPAQARIPTRAQVRDLSAAPAWRSCGLSLVSPYSRLTDNALESGERAEGEFSLREGEAWRVSVVSRGRVVVDKVVRFTGDTRDPVAVIDVLTGPDLKAPAECVAKLSSLAEQAG